MGILFGLWSYYSTVVPFSPALIKVVAVPKCRFAAYCQSGLDAATYM